ncbi:MULTISPECIES: glycine zipper 2TM domain-containing protein [unclassified Wenzhouxiangella]|uniref:glycine zipper 2TM domain-containing protein n=1 Tax=unclassified Wenzhouxiangella TaxID=2613841 RepID=UPI000E32C269|nr:MULTISPECIES: glycine zipper 2TM domain-containing protein [unclassified Wenzhouxiangella]RFF28340.1 glycine zipper 2TM domain-containing protein [Wenzhouxiangella sp. 15181]RFP68039.1 glycine zipper 2TM domain-containing protein [Wenzhouxiangella sp. 15190]
MKARILIMITTLAASGLALAGGGYETARVVDVEPIREVHRTPVDREICREETAYVRERRHSHAPTVFGAIIGGVIGNQFGSGGGRDAATAAGALLGGAIGHDASKARDGRRYPATRERCRIERDWRERTVDSGYRVTYEYGGRLHRTTMAHPPGDTIRVRVSVDPVD